MEHLKKINKPLKINNVFERNDCHILNYNKTLNTSKTVWKCNDTSTPEPHNMYHENLILNTTSQIGRFCITSNGGATNQELFIIYINEKNMAVHQEKIVIKNVNILHLEIIKLIDNINVKSVTKVILSSKHIDSYILPYSYEIELACKIRVLLENFGVKLLDFIITSNGEYFSFMENNLRF